MTFDDGGNLQLCKIDKNIYLNLNLVSCWNNKLVLSQVHCLCGSLSMTLFNFDVVNAYL